MNRPTAARFGAAAVTGALLAAARPPLDLGPLACVAFVPLFVAWRDSARTTAAYAFVAAAVYYAILMSWSWYFGTIAIVPLVIALGAYWAAAGAVLGWLRGRGVANPFLIAAVWVLAEATVARVPLGGFSWGEVGFAFHDIGIGRAGERRRRRAGDVLRRRAERVPRRRRGRGVEPRRRFPGRVGRGSVPASRLFSSSRSLRPDYAARRIPPARSGSRSSRATTRTAT